MKPTKYACMGSNLDICRSDLMPATKFSRIVYILFGAALVIQLTLTLINRNAWPFSSYNMFNFVPAPKGYIPKVEVHFEDGSVVRTDVAELMPLEFFRTNGLLQAHIYESNRPGADNIADFLIDYLNQNEWEAFDEMPTNRHIVSRGRVSGLVFGVIPYDLSDFRENDQRFIAMKPVYRFFKGSHADSIER
jgi:hypothetical protein